MKRPPDISRRHRRLVLAACVALWIGAMVATHIPAGRLPRVSVSDKFLHALAYFGLSGMLWLTLRAHAAGGRLRWAAVLLAVLAYAAVDEITQPIVGRVASTGDWAADALGGAAAVLACELLAWTLAARQRRRASQAP